jgi:hypothetical protein
MKKKTLLRTNILVSLLMVLMLTACGTTISSYDQQAYTQTTSLKVDALNLMDSAGDNYEKQAAAVRNLQINLQKAYEYEKNRPKNDVTVRLWDKLLDKNGHLLGGFIERWKAEKRLGSTFISNYKDQVGETFDMISGLESKKIKDK